MIRGHASTASHTFFGGEVASQGTALPALAPTAAHKEAMPL
jgi:hypothetical protein